MRRNALNGSPSSPKFERNFCSPAWSSGGSSVGSSVGNSTSFTRNSTSNSADNFTDNSFDGGSLRSTLFAIPFLLLLLSLSRPQMCALNECNKKSEKQIKNLKSSSWLLKWLFRLKIRIKPFLMLKRLQAWGFWELYPIMDHNFKLPLGSIQRIHLILRDLFDLNSAVDRIRQTACK